MPLRWRQIGYAPRPVPEPGDFDDPRIVVEAVNNPVGFEDDLPNGRQAKFGHDSPYFWKLGKQLRPGNESQTKPFGRSGIVGRDVTNRLLEILNGARERITW